MAWFRSNLLGTMVDREGHPLWGGHVYVYTHNSTTLAYIAQDESGTEKTNPIEINEYGKVDFYLDDAEVYDVLVKDDDGIDLYSFDSVRVTSGGGGTSGILTILHGGTGANNISDARSNLHVGKYYGHITIAEVQALSPNLGDYLISSQTGEITNPDGTTTSIVSGQQAIFNGESWDVVSDSRGLTVDSGILKFM